MEQIEYNQFWVDFWPSFISTLLGLILGLPIGLWTNRIISRQADKQRITTQSQRVEKALDIIRLTLVANQKRLEELIQTLNNQKILFDTQLDTSAWDAVKDDIVGHLHDSNLKRRIAYHFSRLGTIVRLNEKYISFSVGVESALSRTADRNTALKKYMVQLAELLVSDSLDLLPLIDNREGN